MLHLSFKTVGHGDAIVLEWGNEVGIIDCAIAEPVIEHLLEKNHKRVAFMILSHPHMCHFGGFKHLLGFCRKEGIKIDQFIHTAPYDPGLVGDKFYIHQSELNRRKLVGFYRLLNQLKDRRTFVSVINSNFPIKPLDIENGLFLKFLAPGDSEQKEHMAPFLMSTEPVSSGISYTPSLLSTVIQIYTADWQVLLTSCAERSCLKRVMDEFDQVTSKPIVLAQIPNHGALNNHFSEFWQSLNGLKQSHAVISAGENTLRNPQYETVKFFDKHCHEVLSTSSVGGYQLYYSNTPNKIEENLSYHERNSSIHGTAQNFTIDASGQVKNLR